MSRPQLRRFADADSFGLAAAQHFLKVARQNLADKGSFSAALSGGQGPLPFYSAMQAQPKTLPWSKVRLYWVDERWVPTSDPDSNYGSSNRLFLEPLDASASARPINTALASPQAGADDYAARLQADFGAPLPAFDLCLLGMGPDGHTASLFPGSPSLEAKDCCLVTQHPQSGQTRISLSLPALNASREVLFLVRGEEKEALLQRIHGGPEPPTGLPAALVHGRGACTWLYTK